MNSFLPKEFITVISDNGTLLYFENYLDETLETLTHNISWREDLITIFGKTHKQPRMTAWHGEKGLQYSYSGIKMTAVEWTPELLKIKTLLEENLGTPFNSVLVNYYRDGKDHMSYHADDEKELGPTPTIASLSFGETRSFHIKHKFDKNRKVMSLNLTHGSLVVMKDEFQHFWVHKIAKTSRAVGPRLNLTFRYIH